MQKKVAVICFSESIVPEIVIAREMLRLRDTYNSINSFPVRIKPLGEYLMDMRYISVCVPTVINPSDRAKSRCVQGKGNMIRMKAYFSGDNIIDIEKRLTD